MAIKLNITKKFATPKEIELCVKWLKKNEIKVMYSGSNVGYVVVPYNSKDEYSYFSDAQKFDEYTEKLCKRVHGKEKDFLTSVFYYDEAVQEYAKKYKEAIV